MNLTLNTQWAEHRNGTYLVVTVSAPQEPVEAAASEIYLDIQMPAGVRIRNIGSQPSDGHRNSIGIDLPTISSGDHQNIVFRVKPGRDFQGEIAPDVHLHWRDSQSGDLLERHQVAATLPTDLPEISDDLAEIIRTYKKEQHSMTTENTTNERKFNRAGHECGHRARRRAQLETQGAEGGIQRRPRCGGHRHDSRRGHDFGRHGFAAGRSAREAMGELGAERRYARRHGVIRTIQDLQEQVYMLERRMRRMQRRAKMQAIRNREQIVERTAQREIVRTPRGGRDGFIPSRTHVGRRMHREGRKMGHMARHAFAHRDDRW